MLHLTFNLQSNNPNKTKKDTSCKSLATFKESKAAIKTCSTVGSSLHILLKSGLPFRNPSVVCVGRCDLCRLQSPIYPFHIYMDLEDWLTPHKAAKIKMSRKG